MNLKLSVVRAAGRSLDLRFWGLLSGCLLIIFLKAPKLLLEPRFWAEEASVYFAYARQHSVLESLFLIPTSTGPAGYLLFAANLPATIAAHLLPLEWAPWPMTLMALGLQMLPFALILNGRSRFFRSDGERLLACSLLLFAPSMIDTIWLNAINSQIFCGLIGVLLLGEDLSAAGRRRRGLYRSVLLFCLLSGAYTVFLLPSFAIKHWLERQKETWTHLKCALLGAGLQAFFYLITWTGFRLGPDRFEVSDWDRRLVFIFHHQFVRGLLGQEPALALAQQLGISGVLAPAGAPDGYERLAGWVCLALLVLAAVFLFRRRENWTFLLLGSAWLSLVIGISLSIGAGLPVGRYAVLPGMVVLLLVFDAASRLKSRRRVWICRGLLGLALISGWNDFWLERPRGVLGREGAPPSWAEEVQRWRDDADYPLRIWPYSEPLGPAHVHLEPPNPHLRANRAISFAPLRLISTGPWTERTLPLHTLPRDFKVYFDVRASQPAKIAHLRLRLRDDKGQLIAERRIRGFAQEKSKRQFLQAKHFRDLTGEEIDRVRSIGFALKVPSEKPTQVWITSLHRGARIEGLLEPLIPVFSFPEARYAFRDRPIAMEATSVLLSESLRQEGDAIFGPRDALRAQEWWNDGPQGLLLAATDNGQWTFATTRLYPWLGLPWSSHFEIDGLILFNLLLIIGLLGLAGRWVEVSNSRDRWFAPTFLLASGVGLYVLLPQPEMLRMCCLFVPVGWWLTRQLSVDMPGVVRGVASGVLLALASFEVPVLTVVLLGIAASLAFDRAFRPLRWMALGWVLTLTVLCFGFEGMAPKAEFSVLAGAADEADAPLSTLDGWALQQIVYPDAGTLTRKSLQESWRGMVGEDGLIVFYPFAFLAVILFALGPEDRRRSLLFAVLLVLSSCAMVDRVLAPSAGHLIAGGSLLAVIAPLFLFLPARWGRGWPIVICLLWTFFWTLPRLQEAWLEATFVAAPTLNAAPPVAGPEPLSLEP